ncbi:hypothetical protein [Allobaculum mucilyticum]|uniref:hypothetical protein n=1 Tax=Allobaculum mucilyticum TaxID=2834459 RepID=UPI001E30EC9E|nr:hypothetical protein [Allobaculum mucilyticum]UNT97144.1 hypothetical protein KWG62_05185 [Allobaculum mucilyticum]
MMSKVIFVCGLIGAGKTTWAKKKGRRVTDMDDLPDGSRKKDQIKQTKRLLKKGDVFHITCYPTREELRAFKDVEKDFVLIDTSKHQAKTNILIRGRDRDLENIGSVFQANKEYWRRFKTSDLPFRKVKVMP